MRRLFLIITSLIIVIISCTQQEYIPNTLLNPDKLAKQLISVDVTKDTILRTNKGAIIRIPKGAFSGSNNSTVQLEIKEAYSMGEMLLAGLTTQTNGQPLSSGGMIYINAVGEQTIKITQAISVAIPSPFVDKNMKVFKGDSGKNGIINWIDPKKLPTNPQLTTLEEGKQMFDQNSASCHAIGKETTGPDLAHISKWDGMSEERGIDHLYGYIRNPEYVLRYNRYYRCLSEKYLTVMPAFPNLSDEDLDKMRTYITNESLKRNLPLPENKIINCFDSCELYIKTKDRLQENKNKLLEKPEPMVEEKVINPPIVLENPSAPATDENAPVESDKIDPLQSGAIYYQFTIEAFGWYNIAITSRLE